MTYDQPNDITTRVTIIEDDIDQIRTELRQTRYETRGNSQTIGRLERAIADLALIALSNERKVNAIIEYLRDRNGGSSSPEL